MDPTEAIKAIGNFGNIDRICLSSKYVSAKLFEERNNQPTEKSCETQETPTRNHHQQEPTNPTQQT